MMNDAALPHAHSRVGYVLKMYPRYSETFIVTEIMAHEAAGLDVEIFSLRSPIDTHFQDVISRVRSPVIYIESHAPHVTAFWSALNDASGQLPGFWTSLADFATEGAREVHQAVLLACIARKSGITHLHAHFASVATTVARMAAKFAGIPYTFTAHAKDIFHEAVSDADLRNKLRDSQAAVTVSDYNVRYLRERHGKSATHLRRIYNGLDVPRFTYSSPVDRDLDVVAVGRLVEKKGFEDLIAACAILRDRGKTVSCQIVGSGPLEGALQAQIRALGLEKSVVAVGPRPQALVFEIIQRARVLAAPCVEGCDGNLDGLPTVLLEAMALGTPAIATPLSGIPEAIHDGKTGLLTPPGDPAALASSIERLLNDQSLRVSVAQNARKLIEAEFDTHRNSARLRELFFGRQMAQTEAA